MKLFVSFIILGLAGAYPTVSETACDVCKTSIVQIQELFSDENVAIITDKAKTACSWLNFFVVVVDECDAKVEGGVALVAAYIGGLNPDSICTQISDCDGQIVIIPPGDSEDCNTCKETYDKFAEVLQNKHIQRVVSGALDLVCWFETIEDCDSLMTTAVDSMFDALEEGSGAFCGAINQCAS